MTKTIDPDHERVVNTKVSFCEDQRTIHVWQTMADGRQRLSRFTLGEPPGQDQRPRVVEGV